MKLTFTVSRGLSVRECNELPFKTNLFINSQGLFLRTGLVNPLLSGSKSASLKLNFLEGTRKLSHGVMIFACQHAKVYGYEVMDRGESPALVFRQLFTRFTKHTVPKKVILRFKEILAGNFNRFL